MDVKSLLIGAFLGFLVEFLFDYFVTRRRRVPHPDEALVKRVKEAEEQAQTLKTHVVSLDPLRNQVSSKQAEIKRLTALVKKLEASQSDSPEIASMIADFDNKQQELAQKTTEVESLKAKLEESSRKMEEMAFTYQKGAETDKKRLVDELQAKDDALDKLRFELEEFRRQGPPTKLTDDEFTVLRQKTDQQSNEIKRLEYDAQILQEQLAHFKSEAERLQAVQAEKENMHSDQADLEQHLLNVQRDLAAKDDHIQLLENRLRTTEEDLESLNNAHAELNDLRASHQTVSADAANFKAQIEDQEREIALLRGQLQSHNASEHDDLSHQLQVMTQKAEALERDVESLREVSASKDHAISETRAMASALESQLAFRPAPEEHAKLKSELEAKDAHILELQSNLEQHSSRPTQEEFASLKENLESKDQMIKELSTKVDELASRPSAEEHAKLRSDLETMDALIRELNSRIDDQDSRPTHEDLAHLQSQVEAKEAAIQELAARPTIEEHAKLRTDLDEMSLTVQDLHSKVEEHSSRPTQDEIENLRSELSAKDLSIQELHVRLDELSIRPSSDEHERLKAEVASMGATLEELKSRPTHNDVSKMQAELEAKDATIQDLQSRIEAIASQPVPTAPKPEPIARPYVAPSNRDPLIQIPGIGHLYERKLWEAGILTFADLARSNPAALFEIIQPAEWQRIEPEVWISEAQKMAHGAAS